MRIRAHQAIVSALYLFVSVPVLAFDPATDHTCVYNCDGGSAPTSGGGYVAPAPSGPSPAELARRRQHAAGIAANNHGAAALKRKLNGSGISSRVSEMLRNYKEAIADFELAARYLPNDSNVHLNLTNTRGMVAQFEGHYEAAVRYFEEALRYSPHNATVKANLKRAREVLTNSKDPNEITLNDLLGKAQSAEKAQDWDAAVRYRQDIYHRCLAANKSDCDIDSAFAQYARGRKALTMKDWKEGTRVLRAVLDFYEKKFGDNPGLGGLKEWKSEIVTALQIAEAQQKAEEPRPVEVKDNPNYPNPPPVYRDANTPRRYPDLGYYTPAQHNAHNDNDTGNTWAQKGDWAQALLSYQRALQQDPGGPFSMVIKENLDIAMKHLKDNQAKTASTPTAVTQPPPPKPQEPPKEVTASNCTGWMAQSGGASFRLCTDERGQRYCEQANGNGLASRVSCQ